MVVLLWSACPGALPRKEPVDLESPPPVDLPFAQEQTSWLIPDASPFDAPSTRADAIADLAKDTQGSGPPQTCTTASCVLSCPAGHCDQDCGSATACISQCNPGGCSTKCGTAKSCVVYCTTGNCTVDCGTSICAVLCNGGGCVVECAGAAACSVVCPTNNCTIHK